MPDDSPIPADLPPLPVLLRRFNKSLNWNSAAMGRWMGWDSAQVSRVLNVNSRQRLQDATIDHLARRYQDAGLAAVTPEMLKAARDYGGRVEVNTYAIPDHWLRLVKSILTLDPELQDKLFTRWQDDVQLSLWLIFRGHRDAPDPTDSPDER